METNKRVTPSPHGSLQCYPLRLKPGEEIKESLATFTRDQGLSSAFVLSCVGSVTKATLRMADANQIQDFTGPFEIVSLVGTVSGGQAGHLHASLSDTEGKVIGGHVISMPVFTTAEVMLGNVGGVEFKRTHDAQTGFDELEVHSFDK